MRERALPGRSGTNQCRSLTLRPWMALEQGLPSPSKTPSRLSRAPCSPPRPGPRQRTPVSPNHHCTQEIVQPPLRTPLCWFLLPAPAVFRRCLSVRRPRQSEDWATAPGSEETSWVSARASPARIAPAPRPPPADGQTCGYVRLQYAGLGREFLFLVAMDTQHPLHRRTPRSHTTHLHQGPGASREPPRRQRARRPSLRLHLTRGVLYLQEYPHGPIEIDSRVEHYVGPCMHREGPARTCQVESTVTRGSGRGGSVDGLARGPGVFARHICKAGRWITTTNTPFRRCPIHERDPCKILELDLRR